MMNRLMSLVATLTGRAGRRMRGWTAPSVLLLALFAARPASAAFLDVGVGARPVGMGNAFTAVADDVNALYYNPAGLSQLQRAEFTSHYGRMFVGLDDGSNIGTAWLAFAYPMRKWGTPAIGWNNLTLSGLYQENTFMIGYGKKVFGSMRLGLAAKLLQHKYRPNAYTQNAIDSFGNASGATDPVFARKYSKSAMSFDFGLLYSMANRYYFALDIMNLMGPNVGIKDADKVATAMKLGFAYRVPKRMNLSVQMEYARKDFKMLFGGEGWLLNNSLGLRAGLGVGSRAYRNLAVGASYKVRGVEFDYAFIYPLEGIRDTFGSHRVALGLQFGKIPKEAPEKEQLKKAEEEKTKAVQEAQLKEEEAKRLQEENAKLSKQLEDALRSAQTAMQDKQRALEDAQRSAEQARAAGYRRAPPKPTQTATTAQPAMMTPPDEDLTPVPVTEAAMQAKYAAALAYYNKRVAQGAGTNNQLAILADIIKKYDGHPGIDLADVKTTYSNIRKAKQVKTQEIDYAWQYYQQYKQRARTKAELVEMLQKTIDRYKNSGQDLSRFEQELRGLQQ